MARTYGNRGGRYFPRAERTWFTADAMGSVAGTLANGAGEAVADLPLEHPGTSEDYDAGTIEGLRLEVFGATGATTVSTPPTLVVMVLRQGETVPAVTSAAVLKQNEDRVWLKGKAELRSGAFSAGGNTGSWSYTAYPRTGRKFQKGDRLVIYVVNRDGTTWANPHTYAYSVDAYLSQ